MKLLNVSFGVKLAGAFGLVLTLLVAMGLTSYFGTRQIARQASEAEYANKLAVHFSARLVEHLD